MLATVRVTIKQKTFFNLLTLFFFSVIFIFVLYLARWATFLADVFDTTYLILIIFEATLILVSFYPTKKKDTFFVYEIKNLSLKKITIHWAYVAVIAMLFLAALQNLYLAHDLFPALHNIDIHVSNMPFVSAFVAYGTPICFVMAYLEFQKTKKPLIIFLNCIFFIYLLLGKSSRIQILFSLLSFVYFYLFYRAPVKRKNSILTIIILSLFALLVVAIFALAGNFRIGSASYDELIGYTGPFHGTSLGNVLAWFYGYFPCSYDVLNLSSQNVLENHLYTNGLMSFMPFLTLTKIYKLIGITSSDLLNTSIMIQNSCATVPTAFLYFFIDFGFLYFVIPLALIVIFEFSKKKNDIFWIGLASLLATSFSFYSFQWIDASGGLIYTALLFWVLQKFFVKKSYVKKPEVNIGRMSIKI